MVFLILLVILFLLSLIIVPFLRQIYEDKKELQHNPIYQKFSVTIAVINERLLGNQGELTLFDDDPRLANLMSDNQRNLLIQFYYSTGSLTITLNYKYFREELIHKEQYHQLRNISVFQQTDIARAFVEVCQRKISEFQQQVGKQSLKTVGTTCGPRPQADPTSILSAVYDSLSHEQKISAVNVLAYIAQAVTGEQEAYEQAAVTRQLLLLGLKPDECAEQLRKTGIEGIGNDLREVETAVVTSLLLPSIELVATLNPQNEERHHLLTDRLLNVFGRLGYTKEKIEQEVQKIRLLGEKFK